MIHERKKTAKGIIIIPNENIHKGNTWEKYFVDGYHQEVLLRGIYETKIVEQLYNNLTVREKASIHNGNIDLLDLVYRLVEIGYCAMLYDKVDTSSTLLIYLPNQLGVKQIGTIKNIITKLGEITLLAFELDESEELFDCYKETKLIYNSEYDSKIQLLMDSITLRHNPSLNDKHNKLHTLVRSPQNDKNSKNS